MALVIALGIGGIGYAMWSEDLTVDGTVYTGEVAVEFSQYSNDAPPHGPDGSASAGQEWKTGNLDPEVPGTWTPSTKTWAGDKSDKNVASTDCSLNDPDNDVLTITVDNGYPCYFGSILYDISNVGTIPVKVLSHKLISVSDNVTSYPLATPMTLTACKWYYVNVDTSPPTVTESATAPPTGAGAGDDFAFHLSDYGQFDQIDPDEVGYGDITIHIEQDAEEATDYDFSIKVSVCNWNEP